MEILLLANVLRSQGVLRSIEASTNSCYFLAAASGDLVHDIKRPVTFGSR